MVGCESGVFHWAVGGGILGEDSALWTGPSAIMEDF
jgi:hypothetical protein